jgi:hypothetical protein
LHAAFSLNVLGVVCVQYGMCALCVLAFRVRRVFAEDVFVNESACVGDFLREATAVLRTLYPPLSNFTATQLWMEGSLCKEIDKTPMRNFARRDQTMPVLVELEGLGLDMGRPEVETVRCSCGCVSVDL